MPPLSPAVQAVRLTDGYMGTTARIRASVALQVQNLWLGSPGYRDGDIERLVARIVPLVQAGQFQLANISSVFLAQQATLLRGVPYVPVPVDREALRDIRGVPDTEVFRRPAVALYTALKDGKTFTEAVQISANRLASITGTHLQLAKFHQSTKSMQASGAQYFRRVLSGSENCRICTVAATQRYKVINSPAVHPGCDCGVQELPAKEAPGKIIDPALLKAVADLEDKDGKLDARDLITVQEHGELGPVLTWRKHEFTGPAALENF